MTHRLLIFLGALFVATLGLPHFAVAQETEETQAVEKTQAAEEAAKGDEDTGWLSRFSGIAQADFTNAYFFRGIKQEREGFIAEPWGELYFNAYKSDDGLIRDITVGAGVWASFHTEKTFAQNDPRSLYETDWYPLVSIGLPYDLTLTTVYYWYTSPNDAFRSVQELNFKLAWDDSETLGRFALAPWINLAIETERTSFGPSKGEGLQMGVAPTLFTIPLGDYPIAFTLPLELGLALNKYYEHPNGHESTFGYFSSAGSASMPLAFVPKGFGSWSVTATAKGYFLSNTLKNANNRQSTSGVYTGSLTLEF